MSTKQFTIFGANGFVGSHLARYLANGGYQVNASTRASAPQRGVNLGHAVYAIGVTADFRQRPFDTIAAHVSGLADVLQNYEFDSFLYLSSTRLYRGAASTREDAEIRIAPSDPERFYDATKLAGEALCLALPNQAIRVVRLSNLYGASNHTENFLSQVLAEALQNRRVTIRTGAKSAKDYLQVEDACSAIAKIALGGHFRVYNVASGRNVTNAEIARLVAENTKAKVNFASNAPEIIFPPIDTKLLASEIPWEPHTLAGAFQKLIERLSTQIKS